MQSNATATSAAEPAIALRNARFTYPARRRQPAVDALQGVDLVVPAGQSVAVLGPNGSGKSTLLKVLCGLLSLRAGSVQVFGEARMQRIRQSIGVVFQSPALDANATVFENLRDQAVLHGVAANVARSRIETELNRSSLLDRRNTLVRTLSGGLARRVDLIRAMLHEPRLLLLDEPTAGLDPSAREHLLVDLQRLRTERRLTILMNTHLIDEADRQDRVLLMHRGRVAADGAPQELRARAGRRRLTVIDPRWSPAASESQPWVRTGAGWSTELSESSAPWQSAAEALAKSNVAFSIAPPTLADIFEQVTGATLEGHALREAAA